LCIWKTVSTFELSNSFEKTKSKCHEKTIAFLLVRVFLFAIYLNVFYKEDSFLARVVAGKSEVAKQQTAQKQSGKEVKSLENELAENSAR
jgi:hypothetical protein